MSKCQDCDCEMKGSTTCTHRYIMYGIELYARLTQRNGVKDEEGAKCHDCGITIEGKNVHHYGCDWEECPRCRGQMLSCGCNNVFCDDSCGDWYNEGCEKEHAGNPYHSIPNGYILKKPSKEMVKKITTLRNLEMNTWMQEGDIGRAIDMMKKSLKKKGTDTDIIVDMIVDEGKKLGIIRAHQTLIRERNRSIG